MRVSSKLNRNGGYTLLELLLALGLTVVVISTIASAIHVNLFSLQRAQARIERKQVARSVLAMIGNDVRAAVQFKAVDYTGLEDLLLTQQLAGGVSASAADLDDPDFDADALADSIERAAVAGAADEGSGLEDLDGELSEEEEEEEVNDWSVGLIGEPNFIWLDISRLPRIDQYHPLIRSAQDAVRTGSDIKQVVYYVGALSGAASGGSQTRNGGNQSGLIRDEIDRGVAFYEGGIDPTSPKDYSQLVAPEVVQISFRYFNGDSWVTSWDSAENEGFPTAVEISIVLDSASAAGRTDDLGTLSTDDEGRYERYRSVVHLPLAKIADEEDTDG